MGRAVSLSPVPQFSLYVMHKIEKNNDFELFLVLIVMLIPSEESMMRGRWRLGIAGAYERG